MSEPKLFASKWPIIVHNCRNSCDKGVKTKLFVGFLLNDVSPVFAAGGSQLNLIHVAMLALCTGTTLHSCW